MAGREAAAVTALLALATSRIGLLVIAFVSLIIFYEGVPIGPLRWIPLVGPVLEVVTDGRVDRERKAAREGYVQEARLIAAQAQLAETQRQLAAGRKALDGYAALLAEAQTREAALSEQDAIEDADYEAKLKAGGRSCPLSADDLDWLRR
jgi:hypothetical protein